MKCKGGFVREPWFPAMFFKYCKKGNVKKKVEMN